VEGNLLGCDHCANLPAGAGIWLTAAEWDVPDAVREALAAFAIGPRTLSRTAYGQILRPRAHVWFVSTGGRTYVLRRHDNAPSEAAVRFEGTLRERLAAAHLPVTPFMPARGGDTVWTDARAARWTLHEAPQGTPCASNGELWGLAGAIGGTLAKLHATVRPLATSGAPLATWEYWREEQLHARLALWPSLPELTHELRDQALERLTTSQLFATLPRLPQTITHGNFGRAAIFKADTFGLVGIGEFERAHPAAAICDFAFGPVNQFRPVVRAAVSGYERTRRLEPAERDALPEVLLLGTLIRADRQLTIWHDDVAANQYAKAITHLLANADGLRRLT
jgi:Ser/Thr protein kinase RdoA (MazF antagonist)